MDFIIDMKGSQIVLFYRSCLEKNLKRQQNTDKWVGIIDTHLEFYNLSCSYSNLAYLNSAQITLEQMSDYVWFILLFASNGVFAILAHN